MRSGNKSTLEEKEQNKADILQMLNEGLTYSQMSVEIGRSNQTIGNMVQELIEEGKITREQISAAKKRAKQQRENEIDEAVLGLYGNTPIEEIVKKLRSNANVINLSIQRLKMAGKIEDKQKTKEKERKSKMRKLLELLKEGKTVTEASRILNIPSSTIERYIQELISDGEITESQIIKEKDRIKQRCNETEQEVLRLLSEGELNQTQIARKLGMHPATIVNIKRKNNIPIAGRPKKENNVVSKKAKSELEKNVNEQKCDLNEEEKTVYNLLKEGYTYSYISNTTKIPSEELNIIIAQLKKKRIITSDEIKEAREQRRKKDEDTIYQNLVMGNSQTDIIREYPHMNTAYVSRTVKKMQESGRIKTGDLDAFKQNAEQGINERKRFVYPLLLQGYNDSEIAEMDPEGYMSPLMVKRVRKILVEEHRIDEKLIKKGRRKKRRSQKRMEDKENYKVILELLQEGLEYKEISEKIFMSYTWVTQKIQEMKKTGIVSDDEIKKWRIKKLSEDEDVKRFISELNCGIPLKELAEKRGETYNQVVKRRIRYIELGLISREDIENGKNPKGRADEYKHTKRREISSKIRERIEDGKNADKLIKELFEDILNDPDSVDLEEVEFLDYLLVYVQNGINMQEFSFIIKFYIHNNMFDKALKLTNTITRIFEDNGKLKEFADNIKLVIRKKTAVNLLKEGKRTDYIAQETGLMEIEVLQLKRRYLNGKKVGNIEDGISI